MKYIVTVETNYDTEVACLLSSHKDIGTLKEVRVFIKRSAKDFPKHLYRIYRIKEKLNE